MKLVRQSVMVERTGVFSNDLKRRYEYTMERKDFKGKNILVICINPASDNLLVVDTTTNYLMNNLFSMGFSSITLCNLFADVTGKLEPTKVEDNPDNMAYLKEVLERNFDTILLGFGNTFVGNKKVKEEKQKLFELLKPHAKKLVEIVDEQENYKDLQTIHPLFAGQRFSGSWKFRKFNLPK